MNDHFGVRLRVEAMSLRRELGTQLYVVEDLAVEHHVHVARGVVSRLIAAADVDDAQTRVRQAATIVLVVAVAVRATMMQSRDHRLQLVALRPPIAGEIKDSRYAAHGSARQDVRHLRPPG
jgi:hypothetical protein